MSRIGKKYGPWVVIEKIDRVKLSGKWTGLYRCRCSSCGTEEGILAKRFYYPPICVNNCNKKTRESKHGMSRTNLYGLWSTLKARCLSVNDSSYKRYGAKGVTVCDKWLSFEGFFEDMGNRPTPIHTIDRIDNKKGYSKENCRWATYKEQANNRSTNRKIEAFGQIKNLGEWAEECGLSKECLKHRLDSGWPIEKAIAEPPMRGKRTYANLQ